MQSMQKEMEKTTGRDTVKAALVLKTSEITGLSPRSVNRVLDGNQNNESVLSVHMELQEGFQEVVEKVQTNFLLEAVNKLVPFPEK
jgi:ATP-dependent phosphoenolpyruvate carboxykinase